MSTTHGSFTGVFPTLGLSICSSWRCSDAQGVSLTLTKTGESVPQPGVSASEGGLEAFLQTLRQHVILKSFVSKRPNAFVLRVATVQKCTPNAFPQLQLESRNFQHKDSKRDVLPQLQKVATSQYKGSL